MKTTTDGLIDYDLFGLRRVDSRQPITSWRLSVSLSLSLSRSCSVVPADQFVTAAAPPSSFFPAARRPPASRPRRSLPASRPAAADAAAAAAAAAVVSARSAVKSTRVDPTLAGRASRDQFAHVCGAACLLVGRGRVFERISNPDASRHACSESAPL